MSVFDLDKRLNEDFAKLRSEGFEVASKIAEGGPPATKATAIKLVTDDPDKLDTLSETALDFEKEIRSYPGAKNVENSAGQTPGQFVFTLKKDVITTLGIPPSAVMGEIVSLMNGVTVGTIAANGEDLDVVLKYSAFTDGVNPEEILSHTFTV